MTQEVLRWASAGLFIISLVAAAVSDLRWRRIPNLVVVGLLALYLAGALLRIPLPVALSALGAAILTFAVTYGLYHFGVFGAGDAKLFTVTALFFGLEGLAAFALSSVLIGGVMALGAIVFRPRQVLSAMTARGRKSEQKAGIPYGVAIALGAILTACLTPGFLPGLR